MMIYGYFPHLPPTPKPSGLDIREYQAKVQKAICVKRYGDKPYDRALMPPRVVRIGQRWEIMNRYGFMYSFRIVRIENGEAIGTTDGDKECVVQVDALRRFRRGSKLLEDTNEGPTET